jgi:hypothetical protein
MGDGGTQGHPARIRLAKGFAVVSLTLVGLTLVSLALEDSGASRSMFGARDPVWLDLLEFVGVCGYLLAKVTTFSLASAAKVPVFTAVPQLSESVLR